MTIWPETLPQTPLIDSFRETVPDILVRSQVDQGPAKLRRRTTAGVRRMQMTFMMDTSEIAALEDFFMDTLSGGALPFDFVHPRTGETVSCRFKKPPEYGAMNGAYFKVAAEMEVMP